MPESSAFTERPRFDFGQFLRARARRPPDPNREAALALAEAGLFAFPCDAGKRPLCRWREESTTDIATIERWWVRHPGALPALDLAKARLIVIDADRHGGPDGVEALRQLVGGDLISLGCPIVETQGDGLHLVFRQLPGEPLGNSTGALPPGIDVRGSGGYVIAPGAMLADGRGWRADPDAPDLVEAFEAGTIPPLPEVLLRLIRAPKPDRAEPQEPPREPRGPSHASRPSSPPGARDEAYARAALDENARELAAGGEGGRNQLLNAISYRMGRMIAAGWIGRSEVEARLEDACHANGLTRDDGIRQVRATIRSGTEGGLGHPADPLSDDGRQDEREPLDFFGARGRAGHDDAPGQDEQRADGVDPLNGVVFDGDVEPAPPKELVKKLLPFTGVAFLGGQPAAGKTFALIDLVGSLATGAPFFGLRVAERVGAVILAAEGEGTLAARVEVMKRRKAAEGEFLPLAWMGDFGDLTKPNGVRALIGRLKAVDAKFRESYGVRLGLIAIDTLAAGFRLENENDNSEASRAISAMNAISREVGALVMPVHHYGKTAETGLRGASAWLAGADVVLAVTAEVDDVHCVKRRLSLEKSRTGPTGWACPFDLRFVELGRDEDGDPYGACFVEPGRPEAEFASFQRAKTPKTPKLSPAARAFRDALLNALADGKGKKVRPFGGEGSEVHAADQEAVRVEFNPAWPADGDTQEKKSDARRNAFNRGREALIERDIIGTLEMGGVQFVWMIPEGDQ